MKHLLAAIACCLAVAGSAQTWNPDADFDNVIGVNDLMALLSVFGTEWTEEYPQNPEYELAAYYAGDMDFFECERACASNHAKIIGLHEFAMFQDSIMANIIPILHPCECQEYRNAWLNDVQWGLIYFNHTTYSDGATTQYFRGMDNFPTTPENWGCFCTGLVPVVE